MEERTGLPEPSFDSLNAPYLEGAREGKLRLPICRDCGHLMAPPVANCVACMGENIGWTDASGRGSVFSYIEYHRSWVSGFEQYLPYNVAIVELAEGPKLISNVLLNDDETISVGQPVRVIFEQRAEWRVPVFVIA
jgi:uncharacterized protein